MGFQLARPRNLLPNPVQNLVGAAYDTYNGRVSGQTSGFGGNFLRRTYEDTNQMMATAAVPLRGADSLVDAGLTHVGAHMRRAADTRAGRATAEWLQQSGVTGVLQRGRDAALPSVQSVRAWGERQGEQFVRAQTSVGISELDARRALADTTTVLVGVPQLIPLVRGAGVSARTAIAATDRVLAGTSPTELLRLARNGDLPNVPVSNSVLSAGAGALQRQDVLLARAEASLLGRTASSWNSAYGTYSTNLGHVQALQSGWSGQVQPLPLGATALAVQNTLQRW